MKIGPDLTEDVLLAELGHRVSRVRIGKNLTQAELAERAGVSRRTIERLESGAVGAQLSIFLRVCRALGLLERLELFLPEPTPGPMALLMNEQKQRRRASGRRGKPADKPWTWGNES